MASFDEVTGEPYFELVDVAVAPKYRGAGLSHALQAAVEERAAAARLPLLSTYVPTVDNAPLLDALIAVGWRPVYDWWRTYSRD